MFENKNNFIFYIYFIKSHEMYFEITFTQKNLQSNQFLNFLTLKYMTKHNINYLTIKIKSQALQ